jgi:hypothetical protein
MDFKKITNCEVQLFMEKWLAIEDKIMQVLPVNIRQGIEESGTYIYYFWHGV